MTTPAERVRDRIKKLIRDEQDEVRRKERRLAEMEREADASLGTDEEAEEEMQRLQWQIAIEEWKIQGKYECLLEAELEVARERREKVEKEIRRENEEEAEKFRKLIRDLINPLPLPPRPPQGKPFKNDPEPIPGTPGLDEPP